MSEPVPEFSRLIPLSRLRGEPITEEIAATPAEREALARRFELLSLERLAATVELTRQRDSILLRGAFEAEFVQSCVVTLEPVPGRLSERFSLRYGPPESEPDPSQTGADDEAFEPLSGDSIDLGEAVAQELSLALPAFPRDPAALIEGLEAGSARGSAFAALAGFTPKR